MCVCVCGGSCMGGVGEECQCVCGGGSCMGNVGEGVIV